MTYEEVRQIEVDWYREHGQFPDRIGKNLRGDPYVVPDLLWNRRPENLARKEHIDLKLSRHVADVHYGWKL